MSRLTITALLVAAFTAAFLQAHASGLRHLLGAQLDLLTPLVVYAALLGHPATLATLATLGGLWLDALSVNPFGISILPLYLTGFLIQRNRELIQSDHPQTQWIVGLIACTLKLVLTLVLLLSLDHPPHLGWDTLWTLLVVATGGAALTPAVFWAFDRFNQAVHHPALGDPPFRADREIKRGRL